VLEAPKHRPDDLTGVPGMTSWSRVYLFVGGCFLLWLTLLTLLTLSYS
jgi:hypothetical protein